MTMKDITKSDQIRANLTPLDRKFGGEEGGGEQFKFDFLGAKQKKDPPGLNPIKKGSQF
jgi:hypothetical protein